MTFELTFQAKTENGTLDRQTTEYQAASQYAADNAAQENALVYARALGYVDVVLTSAAVFEVPHRD